MSWENILKAKDDWKKKLKVGTKPKKETMILKTRNNTKECKLYTDPKTNKEYQKRR